MADVALPFPPSLNNAFSQTRSGRRFRSPRYTRWRFDAVTLIRAARLERHDGPVQITIGISPPDLRRRDIDNLVKPILDALVSAGVLAHDDGRVVRKVTASWLPANKRRPEAHVNITREASDV